MTKVQTKSGFVWNVDERKAADWDFVCALVDCEDRNDEVKRLKALKYVVINLLGEDGAEALADHVKDKDGIKSTAKVLAEFREILTLLGEDVKKSQSSQG